MNETPEVEVRLPECLLTAHLSVRQRVQRWETVTCTHYKPEPSLSDSLPPRPAVIVWLHY